MKIVVVCTYSSVCMLVFAFAYASAIVQVSSICVLSLCVCVCVCGWVWVRVRVRACVSREHGGWGLFVFEAQNDVRVCNCARIEDSSLIRSIHTWLK